MQYYERIRALREDRDESQTDLAKAIESAQQQIHKYETGKQEMTVSKLKAICEHYGVSADYILGLPKGLEWPR